MDTNGNDEVVDALKKKYNVDTINTLIVGDAKAYLRNPNRKDISMSRTVGQGDPLKIMELLLDAVWLEGDECIRNDDTYFLQAIPVIEANILEPKKVELKKS